MPLSFLDAALRRELSNQRCLVSVRMHPAISNGWKHPSMYLGLGCHGAGASLSISVSKVTNSVRLSQHPAIKRIVTPLRLYNTLPTAHTLKAEVSQPHSFTSQVTSHSKHSASTLNIMLIFSWNTSLTTTATKTKLVTTWLGSFSNPV